MSEEQEIVHEALPQRHRQKHAKEEAVANPPPALTTAELGTAAEGGLPEEAAAKLREDGGLAVAAEGEKGEPREEVADGKVVGEATTSAVGAADDAVSSATPTIHPKKNFEFLDHTADIQIHAWGADTKDAFENAVLAMFDYVTDSSKVEIDPSRTIDVEASGHDIYALLFAFMDEFLFHFSAEFFVLKEVNILEFDVENFKIKARAWGETFVIGKHPQGTEIKAITFSNMQIWERPDGVEVYVIVDI